MASKWFFKIIKILCFPPPQDWKSEIKSWQTRRWFLSFQNKSNSSRPSKTNQSWKSLQFKKRRTWSWNWLYLTDQTQCEWSALIATGDFPFRISQNLTAPSSPLVANVYCLFGLKSMHLENFLKVLMFLIMSHMPHNHHVRRYLFDFCAKVQK